MGFDVRVRFGKIHNELCGDKNCFQFTCAIDAAQKAEKRRGR